jgi:LysM repeat protein
MLNTLIRPFRAAVVGLVLAALVVTTFPSGASASPPSQGQAGGFQCTYLVRPGDNLYRIGLRFGVSPNTLAAVNHLANVNHIFAGMVLRVPCSNVPPVPPPNCGSYIVQRGDWLMNIAARFGVSWQALAMANHISNPSFIYPGMRLVIPCGGAPVRTLVLQQPTANQVVCSPVRVSGSVSVTPFEATLTGRVYNSLGQIIGTAPVMVTGELGKPGTFNTQFAFDTSRAAGFGRVEVAELSAKDGSVVIRAVVPVRFVCL